MRFSGRGVDQAYAVFCLLIVLPIQRRLIVSHSCKSCLQILNFYFHVKQMVQLGNLSLWSTLGTLDSIWNGRDFMMQATYYAKYFVFSAHTSVQFGLMTGITADYGPILYCLGIGAIWLYNK